MDSIVDLTHDGQTREPLASCSLSELAEVIREEDRAASSAASSLVIHAIKAGEALEEAFSRVGPGKWTEWLEAIGLNRDTANKYRRIARYRDEVGASEARTVEEARKAIAGMPTLAAGGSWNSKPELRAEAMQLQAEEVPPKEIAETLGVSITAVRRWVDPEYAARHRAAAKERKKRIASERRAHEAAERLAARQASAKAVGGDLANAYSLIRKTLAAIDRAADQCVDKGDARSLRTTLQSLYSAEDEISRILKKWHSEEGSK